MNIFYKIWRKIIIRRKRSHKPEVVQPPLHTESIKQEVRAITVGIDFGTSSTKVLWFDETRRKRYIAFYEESPIPGYLPYCVPSSVGIQKSRLYFGTTAERLCMSNNIFRSVKTDIGKDIAYNVEKCLENNSEQEVGLQVSPTILATLYIGFIIHQIKNQLSAHYKSNFILNTTFNMAAPLDNLNHINMERRWEQILYYGEKLSSQIHNEMMLIDAICLYLNTKQNNPFTKDLQRCCTFVFPETVSAIISYLNSGKALNGLFGIVDIGAGSTDISFFRHYNSQAELRESFYAAKSEMLAMDEFDCAIMRAICADYNIEDSNPEAERMLLHKIRCAKANIGSNGFDLVSDNIRLSKNHLEFATKDIREKIIQCYKRTLGSAYKKEMRQNSWNKWTLFLIGGGSRLNIIQKDFNCTLGAQINDPRRLDIEIDGRVGLPAGVEEIEWNDEMTSLLAVAYGLSINKLNWPEWVYPKDVSSLAPREYRQQVGRDELYPK
jgi:hypothetical protein